MGSPLEDSSATGFDGDQADDSALNAGAAYLFSGFSGPLRYCQKSTSLFPCVSTIQVSDAKLGPGSGTGDYSVTAQGIQGLQDGLLFAGLAGPATLPFFGGGTLCVQPPLQRSPVQNSGGLSSNTCTGSFSTIVNAGTGFGLGLDPGSGQSAWYQYWFRAVDPNGQPGFGLSAAIQLDFR